MRIRWQVVAGLAAMAMIAVPAGAGAQLPLDAQSTVAASVTAGGSGSVKGPSGPDYYIVQLAGEPLAAYGGGLAGLPPTSPEVTGADGLDSDSSASLAYLDYLTAEQDQFVSSAERVVGRHLAMDYRYRHALNGVALWLTPEEAKRIEALSGVVHVERNTYDHVDTDVGPAWIGAQGIWDGTTTGGLPATRGEGMIAGIIDTGINMDHPSFAAVGEDGYEHANPFGKGKYVGFCDPDNPNYNRRWVCNDKLIGVWSFEASGMSPEDDAGHGSHTASTVAGNVVESAKLFGPTVTISRRVSGVAPHANIIAYDACAGGSCPAVATTAAIDQAVADGVDVINYSIALGQESPWLNSRNVAFLNARKAGVFVSASAGNDGPGPATTSASAPWTMAVAAATHDRRWVNRLIDMTGGDTPAPADITGQSFTSGYGPAPIVHASGYTNSGGQPDSGQCLQTFPPGTWSGQIVGCDRGGIPRTQKGLNVRAGGAGGLVLANTAAEGDSIYVDGHALPAVNVTYADGELLRTWLASGTGHMAAIEGTMADVQPEYGGIMAVFSSRGPTLSEMFLPRYDQELTVATWLDVLKPDITGPGVDVLAAVATDPGNPSAEPEFDLYGGTSMSSPHSAGAAALMRALYPDWTPAQVQSALMSTAVTEGLYKEDGATPVDPFDVGAGRIDLGRAARAALVLDIDVEAFEAADPASGGSPATLNLASMADTACLVNCSWTRTVSSKLGDSETWSVTAEGFEGLELMASPAEFSLEPGESQEILVVADVLGVNYDEWAFGEVLLTPSDPDPDLPDTRLPVSVRSVQAKLPQLVVIEASEAEGMHMVEGLSAIDAAELFVSGYGFTAGEETAMSMAGDPTPDNPYDLGNPTGTHVVQLDIADGARRLVAEIKSSEANDIDLFVGMDVNGDGIPQQNEEVCRSGSPTWFEYCQVMDPAPGKYWILVQNWEASDTPPDTVVLQAAVVMEMKQANLTASGPQSVELETPFDLSIGWLFDELVPGDHWYGAIDLGTDQAYPDDLGTIVVDLIGVEPPEPPTPTIYLPITYRDHGLE